MTTPSTTPTLTAEVLLGLAKAAFDKYLHDAPIFEGTVPPHDGRWRATHFNGHGMVQLLLIASGERVVEIREFSPKSDRKISIWYFGDPDDVRTLTLERYRSGALRAFTSWSGPDVPIDNLPQDLLLRVSDMIAKA